MNIIHRLNTASDALGVTVADPLDGQPRLCFYTAEPWFGWTTVKAIAGVQGSVLSAGEPDHNLWFPGIQTGTTWKAKVECPVGGVDFFNPPTECRPHALVACSVLRRPRQSTLHHDSFRYIVNVSEAHTAFPDERKEPSP